MKLQTTAGHGLNRLSLSLRCAGEPFLNPNICNRPSICSIFRLELSDRPRTESSLQPAFSSKGSNVIAVAASIANSSGDSLCR